MNYQASVLIIIYLFTLIGYSITRGFYSFGAFVTLLFSFITFSIYFFKPKLLTENIGKLTLDAALILTLLISLFLSIIFYGGLYQEKGALFIASLYLLGLACIISLTYIFNVQKFAPHFLRYRFHLLLFIAFLTQIFMIFSSPNPKIDVFDQLRSGSLGLLAGKNPYSQVFPQIYQYPQDYFPYLPLIAVVVLPFNLIFSDPRFSLVFANLLVAYLFRKMLEKSPNPLAYEAIPLIYIFHPQATFMVEQAWVDPIIFAFLALFVYLVKYQKNKLFSAITLALAIGMKQQFLLILPFLSLFKKIPRSVIITAIVLIAASIIPFYLWQPKDFVQDVIINHIQRRFWWHNSLTANSFYFAQFGHDLGFSPLAAVWVISFLIIFSRGIKSWFELIISMAFWSFAFYLFNYQAYMNYYPFITNLMLLGTTLIISDSRISKADN